MDEIDSGLFADLAAIWPERANGLSIARSKGDRLLVLRSAAECLMSSRWGGSWSWITWPVMGRGAGSSASPARRKMTWFI